MIPRTILAFAFMSLAAHTSGAGGSRFSFAALADPRSHQKTWVNALAEIRDMKVNPAPAFSRPGLIVVVGDMDPIRERYEDFLKVFSGTPKKPLFLPVIGNHDDDADDLSYIRRIVIPSIPGVMRRHPTSCDYYVDYKNARFVILDAYNELGDDGVIFKTGRNWTEKAIVSAPRTIEHVFVCLHEPAFPRSRHTSSSFNESPEDRDAFWNMLVRHRDRVRAVFVAHDHFHNRMRVKNPSGRAANDASQYPDEEGGIYQVDCGAAGMGSVSTIVFVEVNGPTLLYRVMQAESGLDKPFKLTDQWTFRTSPADMAVSSLP